MRPKSIANNKQDETFARAKRLNHQLFTVLHRNNLFLIHITNSNFAAFARLLAIRLDIRFNLRHYYKLRDGVVCNCPLFYLQFFSMYWNIPLLTLLSVDLAALHAAGDDSHISHLLPVVEAKSK